MKILSGKDGAIQHLAFTADGRFVTASRTLKGPGSEGIEFWDVGTGTRTRAVPGWSPAYWYVLHPGGKWAYADTHRAWNEMALIDLTPGKETGLKCVAYKGVGVAAAPDGSRVIASARTRDLPRSKAPKRSDTQDWLRCWRHDGDKKPKLEWQRQRTVREPITYCVAFFPDGTRFATYESRHWGAKKSHDSQLAVRDASTGDYIERAPCDGADAVAVSPDGARVVTRWGQKLHVWDAAALSAPPVTIDTGKEPSWYTARFEGYSFAFHPSGQFLAATHNDPTVTLYDARTWHPAKTLTWGAGSLRSVCFSPDGTLAAAGGDAGKIVVWDVDV